MDKSAARAWADILLLRPVRMIVLTVVCVAVFALCVFGIPRLISSTKAEVPYTDRLVKYTPAYADIHAITPKEVFATDGFGGDDLYCQCTLSDGATIWARFDLDFYKSNVDSYYRLDQEVIFETPLRLHGTLEIVGKIPGVFYGNRNNSVLGVKKVGPAE